MSNNKGYILMDVLVAGAVLLFLVYTIVPMTSLLLSEREVLSERRLISSQLHDELQIIVSSEHHDFPYEFIKTFKWKQIIMSFDRFDEHLITGCASWINIKNKDEEVCLYAFLQ